jgi:hypothetical protein
MMLLLECMTYLDLAVQFLATLFGVLLGVPTALWIDRWTSLRHDKQKAVAVLSALKEEINHNIGLLKQIESELTPTSIIYYNMDMNRWRSTSIGNFEGIVNHKVMDKIFRIYYEYELQSRKIDAQFDMHYSVVRATKDYVRERENIVNSILAQIPGLKSDSEAIIKDIEGEIARLK